MVLKLAILTVSLLMIGFLVLLFNANIDQSPNRSTLSVIPKSNQPCFYIEDERFTRQLPENSNVRIWIQDLSVLSKAEATQPVILDYPEQSMPTPRNQETCFFLPNIKSIKTNNPYNIHTSSGYNLDFCLTAKDSDMIVTKVEYQTDPNPKEDARPICSQILLEKK